MCYIRTYICLLKFEAYHQIVFLFISVRCIHDLTCNGQGVACTNNGLCQCNENYYGDKCGGKLPINNDIYVLLGFKAFQYFSFSWYGLFILQNVYIATPREQKEKPATLAANVSAKKDSMEKNVTR